MGGKLTPEPARALRLSRERLRSGGSLRRRSGGIGSRLDLSSQLTKNSRHQLKVVGLKEISRGPGSCAATVVLPCSVRLPNS
jgi:hypothetical protein